MRGFYVQRKGHPGVGTEGRSIWYDLTTVVGAIKRANRLFGYANYDLWIFDNIYRETSYCKIDPITKKLTHGV